MLHIDLQLDVDEIIYCKVLVLSWLINAIWRDIISFQESFNNLHTKLGNVSREYWWCKSTSARFTKVVKRALFRRGVMNSIYF